MVAAALIGAAGGRQRAFNWTMAGWMLCGLLLLGMIFTVDRDVRRMNKRLAREGELLDCGESGLVREPVISKKGAKNTLVPI